jgi:four helix bundle protein
MQGVSLRHRVFFFVRSVIKHINSLNVSRLHFSLFNQLIRSASSIGANIVEARSARSRKDWEYFLTIALKSANEAKYWLCLIRDWVSVDKKIFNEFLKEVNEISKILAASINPKGK